MFTPSPALLRNVMKRPLLTLAFTLTAAFQAAPAWAQGAPTPAPGRSLWTEDFSAGQATPPASVPGGTALSLNNYADANGVHYTSDTDWSSTANECNGWILNSGTTIPATDTGCGNAGGTSRAANGTTAISWLFLQAMADALGYYQGMATGENNVLAAMTNPGSGASATIVNPIQIQADSIVTSTSANPVIEGHYYVASAYFAEVHCSRDAYQPAGAGWTDARETLDLLDSATSTSLVSFTASPCDAAPAPTSTTDPIFTPNPPNPYVYTGFRNTPIYVVMGTSNVWQATAGITDLGIRVSNTQTAITGNDVAIDNLQILDVTPQLYQSFSPASVSVGQTTTLTFTITNTDDLLMKTDWSFTETLPPGLTFAATPNITTDCPSGAVTPSGTNAFKVTGNLTAGMASCTVTVDVTSAAPGTYTNDNLTSLSGLWQPYPAQVTFSDSGGGGGGADMQALVVSGPTPVSAGSSQMMVVSECVNKGPLDAANPTCNVTVAGATGSTTCSTPPSSLAAGEAIICVTMYTKGASAVTVTTTAGSATSDPNMANNIAAVPPTPLSGGGAGATAVPTGKALFWLLLLALAATAWPALTRRASR